MSDRNILYEIKKQASKRSNPYFAPNSDDDDIRQQNKKLRTQLRAKDTEIFRLNSKIEELNQQIKTHIMTTRHSIEKSENEANSMVQTMSQIPMLLQNRKLQQQNELIHAQNLQLNGKNNKIEAELRQLHSDKYELQLKVKEFDILQKMREERFRDQVDRLTPIVIEEPAQFTKIKESMEKLASFLRTRIVEVAYHVFLVSAQDCEGKKKVNSFTIFKNNWDELKRQKANGFAAAVSSFRAVYKVMKIIDQNYGDYSQEEEYFKGTINQWAVESLVEIENTRYKEQERKIFRMLGLKYRCQFPIKGQKHDLAEVIRAQLECSLCWEIQRLLFLKNAESQKF